MREFLHDVDLDRIEARARDAYEEDWKYSRECLEDLLMVISEIRSLRKTEMDYARGN